MTLYIDGHAAGKSHLHPEALAKRKACAGRKSSMWLLLTHQCRAQQPGHTLAPRNCTQEKDEGPHRAAAAVALGAAVVCSSCHLSPPHSCRGRQAPICHCRGAVELGAIKHCAAAYTLLVRAQALVMLQLGGGAEGREVEGRGGGGLLHLLQPQCPARAHAIVCARVYASMCVGVHACA